MMFGGILLVFMLLLFLVIFVITVAVFHVGNKSKHAKH